jgi:Protein of unknown function (DUF1501)
MKLTRRQMMLASLGATQLGLIEKLGGSPIRKAYAAGSKPTKLLCLYVRGGWIPTTMFSPLTQAHHTDKLALPAPSETWGDPSFYSWEQAVNCDGSGHAEAGNTVQRMRIPRLWDEASLKAGRGDGRIPHPLTGKITVNHGWSWMQYELWKKTCVIHGIDQGTAAHNSGLISSLCGAPGGEFRAPAMPAVVANAFFDAYESSRALPAVILMDGPDSPNLGLPSRAAPIRLGGFDTLTDTVSRRRDYTWEYFRDAKANPDQLFDGTSAAMSRKTNGLDEYMLAEAAALRGKAGIGTDAYLSQLYDGYRGVSRTLARDIVDTLEKTPGIDPMLAKPFWGDPGWGRFGVNISTAKANSGGQWDTVFDIALRLLKTDLTSCVSLRVPTISEYNLDSHGSPIGEHFVALRATFEVIGRLLGVMSLTPAKGGGTLLDETQVCIFSEFGRGLPSGGDHWPYTSVALVGGSVHGNRMVGNYDVPNGSVGVPVRIKEEDGQNTERVPKSADVCSTIYDALGIKDHFIPGGYGQITDVLSET